MMNSLKHLINMNLLLQLFSSSKRKKIIHPYYTNIYRMFSKKYEFCFGFVEKVNILKIENNRIL